MERTKRPYPASVTREGPTIEPSGPLLEWLDREAVSGTGERRRFRLPVVVRLDLHAGVTAFIGVDDEAGAGSVALALDDGAMGRSLVDTLGPRCAKDGSGRAFWLEGYWGPLLASQPSVAGSPRPFAVLREHGAIAAGSLRAGSTRALVEVDGGG